MVPRTGTVVAAAPCACPEPTSFFPEHSDGAGSDFTIAQHVADVIGFIEAPDGRPAHLLGHSRGGHIAFRVAQQRPELLRKLVLADPNGQLDASLSPDGTPSGPPSRTYTPIAERVSAGDIDGALVMFCEAGVGPGSWARIRATVRQTWRDNAYTLLGQVDEQRPPFTRVDAESVRVPTLLVSGTETPANTARVLRALAAHIPAARVQMMSGPGISCSRMIR